MVSLMPSKWFSNKNFKLSLPRCRRRSDKLSLPTTTSAAAQDYSPSQPHKFEEAFRCFDGNGDGKISSDELRAFVASMGDHMSHEEAQGIITDHDMDGDSLMDFQDFVQLMERDRGEDDLRRAFEMFEADKGSGCITPNGLQLMLNRLGEQKSYEECEAMIRAFDLDGNGVLDFNEFHTMMT